MLSKILVIVVIAAAVLAVVISMRPDEFSVSRSVLIHAPAASVFDYVSDFRKWEKWSPWAGLDPDMRRTYSDPSSGPGAVYSWSGNNQVGEGSMTATEVRPNEVIRMKLEFLKPFKASNDAEFIFRPEGAGTSVTWSMSGKNNFISKAMGLFMNCDKMVGGQFDQGLAKLKSILEKQ